MPHFYSFFLQTSFFHTVPVLFTLCWVSHLFHPLKAPSHPLLQFVCELEVWIRMLNRKQSFLDITVSSSFYPFPRVTLHTVLCPVVISEITVSSLRNEVITVVVSVLWRSIVFAAKQWRLMFTAVSTERGGRESTILRATDETSRSSMRVCETVVVPADENGF